MKTPKEKAEEMVRIFDFNGYVLNESNLETSKRFANKACTYILEEIDNKYQAMFWWEVIEEIEKL